MSYSKGLHILAEIDTHQLATLNDYLPLKHLLDSQIRQHGLTIVGEIFSSFDGGGGFTGVYCLTESHISIHTWPEFGRVTYDVFLSNYRKNNEPIVRAIHEALLAYFMPHTITQNEVYR